jgi:hypothetical protein
VQLLGALTSRVNASIHLSIRCSRTVMMIVVRISESLTTLELPKQTRIRLPLRSAEPYPQTLFCFRVRLTVKCCRIILCHSHHCTKRSTRTPNSLAASCLTSKLVTMPQSLGVSRTCRTISATWPDCEAQSWLGRHSIQSWKRILGSKPVAPCLDPFSFSPAFGRTWRYSGHASVSPRRQLATLFGTSTGFLPKRN